MDDSQVVTLQGEWQCAKEGEDLLPDCFVGKNLRNDDTTFLVFFAKEPTAVVLAMAEQDVQIVVAKDALRPACCDETLDKIDDCWTIWATVGQIADEDESAAIGMLPVVAVAKMSEQRAQRLDFAMNITNDVQ
jgi:hypothetical protein